MVHIIVGFATIRRSNAGWWTCGWAFEWDQRQCRRPLCWAYTISTTQCVQVKRSEQNAGYVTCVSSSCQLCAVGGQVSVTVMRAL